MRVIPRSSLAPTLPARVRPRLPSPRRSSLSALAVRAAVRALHALDAIAGATSRGAEHARALSIRQRRPMVEVSVEAGGGDRASSRRPDRRASGPALAAGPSCRSAGQLATRRARRRARADGRRRRRSPRRSCRRCRSGARRPGRPATRPRRRRPAARSMLGMPEQRGCRRRCRWPGDAGRAPALARRRDGAGWRRRSA